MNTLHALAGMSRHALAPTLLFSLALALPSAAVAQASPSPTFPGAEWEYVSR